MEIVAFLVPWLLVGLGVVFVAFSGGPGAAREAYLTRGRTFFRIAIPLLYIGVGVAIPAVVLASRERREGNSTELAQKKVDNQSASARGVTGPDLDKIGTMSVSRVTSAIRIGGTGQLRMPSGLLQGDNAKAVAQYVSAVAGK